MATLKDIIAIKGKGDLFRVISKSPKGIIVETLNETRLKFKVEPNLQVLVLSDITVYPKDSEDIFISELFTRYYKQHGLNPPVDNTSESREIIEMFRSLAPNYDEERVYLSDMKKFFKWYKILVQYVPSVLEELVKESESQAEPIEEKAEKQGETIEEIKTTEEKTTIKKSTPKKKSVKGSDQ